MLNSFRKSSCYNSLIVRSFSTTNCVSKSNKEWVAMQRQIKAKKDLEWNKRENTNRFKTNVGIRHQMRGLGFRDPSDPTLASRLDFRELGYEEELTDRLEETMEATEKFQRDLEGHHTK